MKERERQEGAGRTSPPCVGRRRMRLVRRREAVEKAASLHVGQLIVGVRG